MRRFKSVRQAQQFLATHATIHNHFHLRCHRLSANYANSCGPCCLMPQEGHLGGRST
jgi:putative transposase